MDDDWGLSEESSDGEFNDRSPSPGGNRSNSPGGRNNRPPRYGYNNRDGGGGGRGREPYYSQRRAPESHGKGKILSDIDNAEPMGSFWLNLFNLHLDATEDQILEYYKDVPAVSAQWHKNHNPSMDVEFDSREGLETAIDMGGKEFNGQTFCIRASKKKIIKIRL